MTSDVIAWVTLGAVVANSAATVFLAWRTSNMAGSTAGLAEATNDSVALQREELDAVKEQLKLAREQSDLANRQLELVSKEFEQTAEAVEQQLQQAQATTAMANVMQQERELAARPYLTVEILKPAYLDDLTVYNVGRGPALNCVWTYLSREAAWRYSRGFGVAPGTGRRLRASDTSPAQPGRSTPLNLWDYGQLNDRGEHEVADVHALFCQDETGAKVYRFIEGRVGYDTWQGEEPPPPWVTSLLQEFPGLRPEAQTP